MNADRIAVLVTAIGGGGHGEQILKALLHAEKGKYFIVGADAQEHCPQFSWVDAHVVLPLASDKDYITRVLEVCEKFDVKAVFHGCEPELKRFSAERSRFIDRGIFLPINPADLIDVCMNKELTNAKLLELGFKAPKYIRVTQYQDLLAVDWFPVVVKPSVGAGGSANCFIAQSQDELIALATYLGFENISTTFVIQEYVGTPEDEYTVGVLSDMDGNLINSIAVRRLLSGGLNVRVSVPNRTERRDLGNKLVISSGVSHGYVGRFPAITKQCEAIAKSIGARGAINIQCRVVDGEVMVFEINPRFSGTTSLRAMMGYNEPDVLMDIHLRGARIETSFAFEEGYVLRGLVEYKL